jgi:hypothetical protein
MPCQHYKDALIEVAASGSWLLGDLRAHLDTCAECRAAFEQEQTLFASIDAGLQATANAEVPASLLPRVRAGLDKESVPHRSWITNRLVLTSAAVMVVAFFAARTFWRTNVVERPVETTATTSEPQNATPPLQHQNTVAVSAIEKKPAWPRQYAIVKNSPVSETTVRGKTGPEVLVSRDQEILLAEYAAQWNLHKRAPLMAGDSDPTILAQLQVAPIQIDELGVKLLAEEK